MSKQSEAKERQEYVDKFIPGTCVNCIHYTSEKTEHPASFSWSKSYVTEKNIRCGLGGFAVKKMGSCARHMFDDIANATPNTSFSRGPSGPSAASESCTSKG